MRTSHVLVAAFAALVLAGCASISRTPIGGASVGASQFTLGRDWNDVSPMFPGRNKKVRILSLDGPRLNRLYVSDGLAAGEGLHKVPRKDSRTAVIRPDMSAVERMEFVSESLAADGYQRVETAQPRPATWGGQPAIKFDIAAKTPDGLDIQGLGLIAQVAGRTHVMVYIAPAEHYFQASLSEVEQIMASAGVR